jgi:hypothetical protein
MDDETLVIGAPHTEGGKGSVYIFVREGDRWREASRLTSGDAAPNDAFGQAVALSGDIIAVGASGQDSQGFEAGAVYIFQNEQGGWIQRQKLMSSSAQDVRFGWSLAIDGEKIVVGAPYRSSQGEIINVGAATIFASNGQSWEEQTRLTGAPSAGARSSDQFGWSVTIEESVVAVGAPLNSNVYIYRLSDGQWREEMVVQGSESTAQFGYSVSLSNNRLAVGAPSTNMPAPRAGAVFLYAHQANHWVPTAQLSPEGLLTGDRFGWAVALQGDLLAVGAPESRGEADVEESGEIYAFRFLEGQAVSAGRFAAAAPAAFDHFGNAVAVAADGLLVGAPSQDAATGASFFISLK